jgi:hypothetical protein
MGFVAFVASTSSPALRRASFLHLYFGFEKRENFSGPFSFQARMGFEALHPRIYIFAESKEIGEWLKRRALFRRN